MVKLRLAIQTAETKIQGEISKGVQAMHNDHQQTLAQEQSLTSALEQQKRDALALNRKGIEHGVRARDAASNRQIFESLMQRTKETGISVVEHVKSDMRDVRVSFTKIRQCLGFLPEWSVDSGMVQVRDAIKLGVITNSTAERHRNASNTNH